MNQMLSFTFEIFLCLGVSTEVVRWAIDTPHEDRYHSLLDAKKLKQTWTGSEPNLQVCSQNCILFLFLQNYLKCVHNNEFILFRSCLIIKSGKIPWNCTLVCRNEDNCYKLISSHFDCVMPSYCSMSTMNSIGHKKQLKL